MALLNMKKVKMYEQQLDSNSAKWTNFQHMKLQLESTNMASAAFQAMNGAVQANKQAMRHMKVEDVEQLQDEIQEQQRHREEVDELLGQPMGGEYYDDDELLGELEDELEADQQEKDIMEGLNNHGGTELSLDLPEVPSSAPEFKGTANKETKLSEKLTAEEDLELMALQKEMGLV